MKLTRIFRTLAALALGLSPLLATPAPATVIVPYTNYAPNEKLDGVAGLASTYTNATTAAVDFPGLTVSVPYTNSDWTLQTFRVCWDAMGSKATAGYGIIGVSVNGSLITDSQRYLYYGTVEALHSCYWVQRPANSAMIVKLIGASSDTNTFTITNAQFSVERFFLNAM